MITVEEMRPNNSYPVRRKKYVPKWKRVLRKYWPTIRFALILIVAICLIVLMITALINLFSGGGKSGKKKKKNVDFSELSTSVSQQENQSAPPTQEQIDGAYCGRLQLYRGYSDAGKL